MNFLRFLMLLTLGLWVGGILFFSSIEAPIALGLASDRVQAGAMISASLHELHALGMICGLVFIAASLGYSRVLNGEVRAPRAPNILAALMVALTAYSQYSVLPAIARLRSAQPSTEQLAEFQHLHGISVGLEGMTLLLGLALMYLLSRKMA